MAPVKKPVVKNACPDRRPLLRDATPVAVQLRQAKLGLLATAVPATVKTSWPAVAANKITNNPFVSTPTLSI